MIHKKRKHPSPPDMIKSKQFKELIEILLIEKDQHVFENHSHYIKRYSEDLIPLYNGKCGYCETRISLAGSYIPMDHFRPKRKPRDDKFHPGYYWLGYEWTNLLPACINCNSAKSNHFPIDTSKGKRVKEPPMVSGCLNVEACRLDSEIHSAERPLLLHPEIDKPEEHLTFLPDGNVEGISLKGKTTVRICKLSRSELVMARKGVIDKFFKEVVTPLRRFVKNDINEDILLYELDRVFRKMKLAQEHHRPYSRLGWFIFEEFETFFIRRLEEAGKRKSARIVERAFVSFRINGTCRKSKN